jgi:malonyl-CoA O-methyltransferase
MLARVGVSGGIGVSPNNALSVAARFSAAAATYDSVASVQAEVAERVSALVSEAPVPRLALDVGCGTGLLTEKLLRVLPATQLHALDISEAMIERARQRVGNGGRVTWIVADASMPAKGIAYDLIASSSCLHWILPIENAFRSMASRLADGGHLVFGLMQAGTLAELAECRRRVAPGKPTGAALPTEDEVLAAFARTGFRVLRRERSVIRKEYPSAALFLKAIHDQGTTGGAVSSAGSLLTQGELKRLAAEYAAHYKNADAGVTATYDVLYAVARKEGRAWAKASSLPERTPASGRRSCAPPWLPGCGRTALTPCR